MPIVSAVAVILMILVLFLTVGEEFLEARGQKPEKTHEASAANEKTYSLAELQEDFGRLRSVIERKYPMYSSLGPMILTKNGYRSNYGHKK